MGSFYGGGEWEVLAGLNELFINSLNWRNICYIHAIGLSSTSHMLLGKGIFSLVQKSPVLSIFQQLSNCSAVLF